MKTIGTLIAVLVLTATASAGLQLTVNDEVVTNGGHVYSSEGTWTFAIVNETAGTGVFDGGAFILHQQKWGRTVMGNAQIVAANLPGSWSIIDVSADLGMPAFFFSWDLPAIDPVKAGKLVTVDLTIRVGDVGQLTFVNASLEPIFSIGYAEVPEPATLGLIGLGIALIRRRK